MLMPGPVLPLVFRAAVFKTPTPGACPEGRGLTAVGALGELKLKCKVLQRKVLVREDVEGIFAALTTDWVSEDRCAGMCCLSHRDANAEGEVVVDVDAGVVRWVVVDGDDVDEGKREGAIFVSTAKGDTNPRPQIRPGEARYRN